MDTTQSVMLSDSNDAVGNLSFLLDFTPLGDLVQ